MSRSLIMTIWILKNQIAQNIALTLHYIPSNRLEITMMSVLKPIKSQVQPIQIREITISSHQNPVKSPFIPNQIHSFSCFDHVKAVKSSFTMKIPWGLRPDGAGRWVCPGALSLGRAGRGCEASIQRCRMHVIHRYLLYIYTWYMDMIRYRVYFFLHTE